MTTKYTIKKKRERIALKINTAQDILLCTLFYLLWTSLSIYYNLCLLFSTYLQLLRLVGKKEMEETFCFCRA